MPIYISYNNQEDEIRLLRLVTYILIIVSRISGISRSDRCRILYEVPNCRKLCRKLNIEIELSEPISLLWYSPTFLRLKKVPWLSEIESITYISHFLFQCNRYYFSRYMSLLNHVYEERKSYIQRALQGRFLKGRFQRVSLYSRWLHVSNWSFLKTTVLQNSTLDFEMRII